MDYPDKATRFEIEVEQDLQHELSEATNEEVFEGDLEAYAEHLVDEVEQSGEVIAAVQDYIRAIARNKILEERQGRMDDAKILSAN